jgi:hypothetical protein
MKAHDLDLRGKREDRESEAQQPFHGPIMA